MATSSSHVVYPSCGEQMLASTDTHNYNLKLVEPGTEQHPTSITCHRDILITHSPSFARSIKGENFFDMEVHLLAGYTQAFANAIRYMYLRQIVCIQEDLYKVRQIFDMLEMPFPDKIARIEPFEERKMLSARKESKQDSEPETDTDVTMDNPDRPHELVSTTATENTSNGTSTTGSLSTRIRTMSSKQPLRDIDPSIAVRWSKRVAESHKRV